MSKEFPYETTLGQITRGGSWDFDSPYNPTDFAQINGWGSPDNWTPNQIKQFEAWDGHYSGTMHGPFVADDFEFGLQVPGVTELEIDPVTGLSTFETTRGRSATVEGPTVTTYGQTRTEALLARGKELAAKQLAIRKRILKANEAWGLTAEQLKGHTPTDTEALLARGRELAAKRLALTEKSLELNKVWSLNTEQLAGSATIVSNPAVTKPVEVWNLKSTNNPTEYALLKNWSIDPQHWSGAQIAEFEAWDGALKGSGENVWAALQQSEKRLNEIESEALRGGTNPPSEELLEDSNSMLDRLKVLQERRAK